MRISNVLDYPVFRFLHSVSPRVTPLLVIVLHILSALSLCFYYVRNIPSILLIAECACLLLLFLFQVPALDRSIWLLLFLGGNAVSVLIAICLHQGYGIATTYICLFLSILLFRQITLSPKVYTVVHLITALFLTYLLGITDISSPHGSFYLIFDKWVNVNMYGIYALACLMHWVCFFDMLNVKRGYQILGQLASVILGLYYVNFSGCRSAMAVAILFVLGCVLVRRPFSQLTWRLLVGAVLMLNACFILACLYGPESFAVTVDFVLSGRRDIWRELGGLIRQHPIFGNGTVYGQSAHNLLMELWSCLGIVPCISIYVLCMRKVSFNSDVYQHRIAQIAFLSCLPITIVESLFTDMYLYFLFVSFCQFLR